MGVLRGVGLCESGGPWPVGRRRLQNGYELSVFEMDDEVAMETLEATQPTVAVEPVSGTEPCPHCGTPLAVDQRYCLECGAPRTYLSGTLLQRLQAPSTQPPPSPPVQAPPPSTGWQRGNALTLIAGVGVLLLAMGVGVLIGRSGGSSAGTPAPQVISVGGATGGVAGTPTTPAVTPETTPTVKSGTGSPAAKPKAKAAQPSGVGSVPSKPAPPSALKNLRKHGTGESFEQKSKNLPNVVETG
jgi:hypothetical protein